MHKTVMDFVERTLSHYDVADQDVLEVGSYNVNGSVRPYIESLGPKSYLGVDVSTGPGVDKIANCENLRNEVDGSFDLVISTEMLEHVADWRKCMLQMTSMLNYGGFLLLTTRSPGFPYHPYPVDNWRYTNSQMRAILDALNFEIYMLEDDPSPGVLAYASKMGTTPIKTALDGIEVDRVSL
jgi:SAM-dependent methyltransferase